MWSLSDDLLFKIAFLLQNKGHGLKHVIVYILV